MRNPALFEQQTINRLQAHKSSFQTWRCIALACSLLAALLLLSKWQEVSNDLRMLLGIERLLAGPTNGSSVSWPPVPLEQLLPPLNESNFGVESLETNDSMLMSHMQMSLNRELTGSQLLRQEVEVFAAEFSSAKSTLGLSTLLVSVYVISWILMMLATKDTHGSKDISLRNILLLSVFGAIDLAASLGFVMVRLLMYTVKNNSFAAQMLGSSGLGDTPTRLSAEQLTAFTALRLIAMRSCSARVDLYVSILVALLTCLRLYSILRAMTYFRRRRALLDLQYEPVLEQHERALVPRKQIWSTSNQFEPPAEDPSGNQHQATSGPPQRLSPMEPQMFSPRPQQSAAQSFRLTPLPESRVNYQAALSLASFGQRGGGSTMLPVPRRPSEQRQQQPQQHASTLRTQRDPPSLVLLSPQAPVVSRPRRRSDEKHANATAPGLLLVKGRAHHLVTDGNLSEPVHQAINEFQKHQQLKRQTLRRPTAESFDEGLLPTGLSFRSFDDELTIPVQADSEGSTEQVFRLQSSEQNLLEAEREARQPERVRSNGTTYTLLNADQLERMSRKLLGRTPAAKSAPQPPAAATGAKYRLVNARQYRQLRTKSQGGSLGLDSSTSCGPDDSDNSLSAGAPRDRKKMSSLCQTEELVTNPLKQRVLEVPGEDSKNPAGNLLKYYYYT